MKTHSLLFIYLCISIYSHGANRFWVATGEQSWNNSVNWSNSSGGSGGASVPGPNDIAIFNGSANGNCNIAVDINVKGLELRAGYTGSVVHSNGMTAVITQHLTIAGGNYIGDHGQVTVNGNFNMNGGSFTGFSSMMTFRGDFNISAGSFYHNSGTIRFNSSSNSRYNVSSPEPELFNVIVELANNKVLTIHNRALRVLNRIDLLDGRLNNGQLYIGDSCVIGTGYDDGSCEILLAGQGNSNLIFTDGITMSNDINIEKEAIEDTVFVLDMTVSGEIIFGLSSSILTIRQGTLSFRSEFTTDLEFDEVIIESTGKLHQSAGTLNLQGNLTSTGGSIVHTGGLLVFTGSRNQTFDPGNSSEIRLYDVRIEKDDNKRLTINSADTLHIRNDLALIDGLVNGGALLVEGNVNVGVNFDRGTSPLIFGGNREQTLDMNGTPGNFDGDIILQKSSGEAVRLLSPLTIDGPNQDLVLNLGVLATDVVNILTIDDGRSWTGGGNDSYIEGPVLKIGNDAFTFPVGRNGIFAPVSISGPGQINHSFRAQYFDTDPGLFYDPSALDISLDHISGCEFWTLDRMNGDSEVEVTLSWGQQRSCGITDTCALSVARWDGSTWRDHGNGGTSGSLASGDIVTGSGCSTPQPVTDFSPFTLGSSSRNNPLPVKLASFHASQVGNRVSIKWVTDSEINNDYFLVERSLDGHAWESIARVDGAGFSTERLEYSIVDEFPISGLSYYRLKQVDFTGETETSRIEAVHFETSVNRERMTIYPNPATSYIRIRVASISENEEVSVWSTLGKQYHPDITYAGNEITIDIEALPSGMYLVKYGENSGLVSKP